MSNAYKYLEWDSDFFGYKIARLDVQDITEKEFEVIRLELIKSNIKLAYVFINPDDNNSNYIMTKHKADLVDTKVTFSINIPKDFYPTINISEYNKAIISDEILQLSIQSGEYSRYKKDERFINREYERLYTAWITNSIKKIIADEVLVYNENFIYKGVISLKYNKEVATIGILAVDQTLRNKGIGKQLIYEAFNHAKINGCSNMNVSTQSENKIACSFYRKIGFIINKKTNIFHLWL